MSTGARVFLVIALVWLGLWSMGSVLFFRGSASQAVEAEHVARPLTDLSGPEVRVEGVVEPGADVIAPLSGEPCLAAIVNVVYVTRYEDSQDRTQRDGRHVATKRVGPGELGVRVGDEVLAVPLDRWQSSRSRWPTSSEYLQEVPDRLGVTEDEVERARAGARGTFEHFSVDETRFVAGTRVFVVGSLEPTEGWLRLEDDPVLGRVELYAGTQDELVQDLLGSSRGLRIAGWIFAALAGLPLLGLVIHQLRARAKARAATEGS